MARNFIIDIEGWNAKAEFDDLDWIAFDEPIIVREDDPVVQFCLQHFNLHGSRFFNRKYPDDIDIEDHTDWDFFCPSGQNYANFLLKNNFLLCDHDPEYLDEGTEKIWYHPNVPSLQVVQKRNFHQYDALINNIQAYEYLLMRKGFLKQIAPHLDDNEIRERIQENMKRFYIRYQL